MNKIDLYIEDETDIYNESYEKEELDNLDRKNKRTTLTMWFFVVFIWRYYKNHLLWTTRFY